MNQNVGLISHREARTADSSELLSTVSRQTREEIHGNRRH